ncbi:MAG: hypothetical protein ISN29_11485 [Gammaproteobacteria bacterium AqS3]|nr:hypothetical protein [Gammaproteobacteria bacterium AqS3]
MTIDESNTEIVQNCIDLVTRLNKAFPAKRGVHVYLERSKRKYEYGIEAYSLALHNFNLTGYDHRAFWDAWEAWKKDHSANLHNKGTSCIIKNNWSDQSLHFELLWKSLRLRAPKHVFVGGGRSQGKTLAARLDTIEARLDCIEESIYQGE